MLKVIERISLLLLMVVVFLRPLVPESYHTAGSDFTAALGIVADPSPMTTLSIDLAILLAATGCMLARAIDPARSRIQTGLAAGTLLVVLAAALSCVAASNKRLAINATVDWLCGPILALSLVGMMKTGWHRRLILSGILASACVQAAQCVDQYFFSYDDTWQQYLSMKDELWAAQGVALDSPKVALFEGRIRAREASGLFPHSNIAGSYLILCAFAGAGMLWFRHHRREGAAAWGFIAGSTLGLALIFGSVLLTKSLGAAISGVAGFGLWLLLARGRNWIVGHRVQAWGLGWLVALVGCGSVVGYGLVFDSLPGQSLDFRWNYWRASTKMIADHPITGVGRENFGRNYLRYKPIEASEEVATPHNLFVQGAADWGLPGLAGMILMMLGTTMVLSRPAHPMGADVPANPAVQRQGPKQQPQRGMRGQSTLKFARRDRKNTLVFGGLITLLLALIRIPLLGSSNVAYLYYTTVTSALIWFAAFFLFAGLQATENGNDTSWTQRSATSLTVGLFAFILHDMINFAMFVPAAATTFFALLAVGLADRQLRHSAPKVAAGWRRLLRPAAALLGITAFIWQGIVPVARSRWLGNLANEAAARPVSGPIPERPAYACFLRASRADPLDPAPALDRARWLMSLAQQPTAGEGAYQLVADALDEAAARDPANVTYPRMQVQLYQRWAEHSPEVGHLMAAVAAARRAVKLYPLDPEGLAVLAECLERAAESTRSRELYLAAYDTFAKALALDDARPAWEHIRRLPEFRRNKLEEQMAAIRRKLESPSERQPQGRP